MRKKKNVSLTLAAVTLFLLSANLCDVMAVQNGEVLADFETGYDEFNLQTTDSTKEITINNAKITLENKKGQYAVRMGSEGFVTDNPDTNSYLEVTAGNSHAGNISLTFDNAMKSDFDVDFKMAAYFDTAENGEGGYYPTNHQLMNVSMYPAWNAGTAHTRTLQMCGTGSIGVVDGTDTCNCYSMPWNNNSGSYPYAGIAGITWVGATGKEYLAENRNNTFKWENYKIRVTFNNNEVPTYAIYREGSLLAEGIKFSQKSLESNDLTAEEYNNNGINKIMFNILNSSANLSASAVIKLAFDDISVKKYEPLSFNEDKGIDFENSAYKSINRTYGENTERSVTLEDGTTLSFGGVKAGLEVTDNGFVTGNTEGNNYLVANIRGNDGPSTMKLTLSEAKKEDFVIEFKYALKNDIPQDGTKIENASGSYFSANHYSMYLSGIIGNKDNAVYGSRLLSTYGNGIYGVGSIDSPFTGYGFHKYSGNIQYYGGGEGKYDFETVRIVTKFYDDKVPAYDIYRKKSGDTEFSLLNENCMNISYSSKDNNGNDMTAQDYKQYGINNFTFAIRGNDRLTENQNMYFAFDDIKVYNNSESVSFGESIDFENGVYSVLNQAAVTDAKTRSVAFGDGTSVVVSGKSETAVVDSTTGFVQNAQNKYLQIKTAPENGAIASNKLVLNLSEPMKSDFTVKFRYAYKIDKPDSYTLKNNNDYFIFGLSQTIDGRQNINSASYYTTATLRVREDGSFLKNIEAGDGSRVFTYVDSMMKFGNADELTEQFRDIKIDVHFKDEKTIPVMTISCKYPGKEDYTVIASDVPYTGKSFTLNNSQTDLVSEYKTKGIGSFNFDFRHLRDSEAAQNAYVYHAIDDISVQKVKKLIVNQINAYDGTSALVIGGDISQKTIYPQFTITNEFDEDKCVSVVAALYNSDGKVKEVSVKDIVCSKESVTNIDKDSGISVLGQSVGDYVKIFVFDNMDNIYPLSDNYSSKQ